MNSEHNRESRIVQLQRRVWYVLLTYTTRLLTWLVGFLFLISVMPRIGLVLLSTEKDRFDPMDYALLSIIYSGFYFVLLHSLTRLYFSSAGSRLIPNYAIPHFIPIGFLWLFTVVLNIAGSCSSGVPFLPAAGLSLLPWGVACGVCVAHSAGGASSRASQVWAWIACAGVAFATTWLKKLYVMFGVGSSIESYFQGKQPTLSVLLVVGSLITIAMYIRQSLKLSVVYFEHGFNSPLVTVLDAPSEWKQELKQQHPALSTRGNDRRLARAIGQTIGRAWQQGWRVRSRLWSAGNGKANLAWGMFGTLIMQVVMFTPILADQMGSTAHAGVRRWILFAMASAMITYTETSLMHTWRSRRALLEMESLRPISRHQFTNQIATAIAWDLTPFASMFIVILISSVAWFVPQQRRVEWTVLLLIAFGAILVMSFAMCLWSIIIRQEWVLTLISMTTALPILVLFLSTPFDLDQDAFLKFLVDNVRAFFAGSVCFALVACAMAWGAYRSWKDLEMAKCSLCSD